MCACPQGRPPLHLLCPVVPGNVHQEQQEATRAPLHRQREASETLSGSGEKQGSHQDPQWLCQACSEELGGKACTVEPKNICGFFRIRVNISVWIQSASLQSLPKNARLWSWQLLGNPTYAIYGHDFLLCALPSSEPSLTFRFLCNESFWWTNESPHSRERHQWHFKRRESENNPATIRAHGACRCGRGKNVVVHSAQSLIETEREKQRDIEVRRYEAAARKYPSALFCQRGTSCRGRILISRCYDMMVVRLCSAWSENIRLGEK